MRRGRPETGTSPGTTDPGRHPASTPRLRRMSRPSSTAPSGLSSEKRVRRSTIPPGRPEVTPKARRPPRNVPTRCLPTRGSRGPRVARAPPRGRWTARWGRRASARTRLPTRSEAAKTFLPMRHERFVVRRENAAFRAAYEKRKNESARFRRRCWRMALLRIRRGVESGDAGPDPAALRGARSRLLETRRSGLGSRARGPPSPPPPRTLRPPKTPTSSPRRRSATRGARRRPRSS